MELNKLNLSKLKIDKLKTIATKYNISLTKHMINMQNTNSPNSVKNKNKKELINDITKLLN